MQTLEMIPEPVNSFYSKYVKRLLDILVGVFAILILSPLLIIICLLELLFHGSPVIYKTSRPGKNNKIFSLYKFRSMTNNRDENGVLLPEGERLTAFGRFIRRTSIDELPELINIIKGDMSIIGPRPLLIEYLPMYSPRHAARQSVRPGLACVRINHNGDKNRWTWRDQFENDIYYIQHISFITDVKMMLAMIREVLRGSENRTNGSRVPFMATNLDDTGSKNELESVTRFESIMK